MFSFLLAVLVGFLITFPLLIWSFRNIINEKLKRFTLNAPFALGLIGIIGWGSSILVFFYGVHKSNLDISAFVFFNYIGQVLIEIFISFAIAYYLLDIYVKRTLVPIIFENSTISQTKGVLKLGIKYKLFLYFLTVSAFPIFLFSLIYISSFKQYLDSKLQNNVIYTFLFLISVGIILSISLIKLFQKPIAEMEKIARAIQNSDYANRVEVNSFDEIGILGETLNETCKSLEEKELIKDTFGKYVDNKVMKHLLDGNINLGGDSKEVSVLFIDIRNFTSTTENMNPQDIVKMLNEFYEVVNKVVRKHDGFVNKYLGDGVMAVFGTPLPLENHGRNAVSAGKEIINEVSKIKNIKIGIGIYSGEAVAGNFGSRDRMEYTVIGNAVNYASRLEALTKNVDANILISERTINMINDIDFKYIGETLIRGKTEKDKLYTLK